MPGSALPSLVPGHANLAPELTEIHALRTGLRRAPRNTAILRAGDGGVRMRTLLDGWAFRCRILDDGRRQILGILLPGDTFGIETLFGGAADHMVWSATAVQYATFDPDATERLFDDAPWFRRRLMRALADTSSAMQDWMIQLGQCNAEERTAALLMLLYERLEARGLARGHCFRLELTQVEQADALGLHIVHLNRILSRLRARRLIGMRGPEMDLLDLDALSALMPAPRQALRPDLVS